MKNTLLLIGTGILLAATSCSHDKENDLSFSNSSIAFTASVPYAQTQRSVITTQNINEFNVFGYIGDELYMNNIHVTKEGGNWKYTPVSYWPVGKSMDFYSYSPSSVEQMGTMLTADDDFRINSYTNDGTTDFIYAVNKNEKPSESSGVSSRQVQVNFRHALSKIETLFKKKADTGNFKFFVREVRIVNTFNQGNFIFPNSTTLAGDRNDDNTGKWESQTALGSGTLNSSIVGPVSDASGNVPANSTGYMFVIPQEIRQYQAEVPNSAGIYFEVECQFKNGDTDHVIWPNSSITDQTADQYARIRIPVVNNRDNIWEPGHSYVYTIALDVPEEGSTKISFDITVDNYVDYGNTELE